MKPFTTASILDEFRRPIVELTTTDSELGGMFCDALQFLVHYIGRSQFIALARMCEGEERAWAIERIITLADEIRQMPVTYEQDGKGEDAIAHLHYFMGGMDWFITERDKGCDDDPPADRGRQQQTFGLCRIFEEELGYVSLEEILSVQKGFATVELDLHWKPKPVRECRQRHAEAA